MLYVIGDIHGQDKLLEALLQKLPLTESDEIVFVGDYIDHDWKHSGDSRRVIELLLALKASGVTIIFLRGNHEQMLLNAREGPVPDLNEGQPSNPAKFWFRWGGSATMRSYVPDWEELSEKEYQEWWRFIPLEHWEFFEATRMEYTRGPYHFVHAGIEPPGCKWKPKTSFQTPAELWVVSPAFVAHQQRFQVGTPALPEGRIVVCGHKAWNGHHPLLRANILGVDTGAGYDGPLIALCLNPHNGELPVSEEIFQVSPSDIAPNETGDNRGCSRQQGSRRNARQEAFSGISGEREHETMRTTDTRSEELKRLHTAKSFYTIGYGGRHPHEFVRLLQENGVKTIVDVRLRPDRASMGAYVKAKTPDKGIEKLLRDAGIEYISLVELGNPWVGVDDWSQRYQRLMDAAGNLLTERLREVESRPFCLLCAEKNVHECHREHIAQYLEAQGGSVTHIL